MIYEEDYKSGYFRSAGDKICPYFFGALAVAAYFGINPPSSFVAKTVAFAFGLAASSFFPTLIIGIFSKD